MSDYHNTNDYDDGHDDEIISTAEINRAAANAFKSGANAMGKAKLGTNKKFLGLVTMDAGIVDMLDGAYNVGADFISTSVRKNTFDLAHKYSQYIPGVDKERAKVIGAVASVGSTVALKTVSYFGSLYEGVSAQWKAQQDLAHRLGPVLDDIKGNHSLTALYKTSAKDNEIIFAHRKRLGQIANSENLNNITNLAVNSGTSLLLDVKKMGHEWNYRVKGVEIPVMAPPVAHTTDALHSQTTLQTLKAGGIGMLPQLAKRIVATNDYKLQTELQPYSALEMIFELAEQVNSDPKARGFTVPPSFQSPHGRREQYSLEEYLMRICIQHQKDMSYLDPKHSEIRDALREDLAVAMKPLAEAIRKGDFNVLGLVRMVGEGKIIKKQGRAIAPASEVIALIKKEEPKQTNYTPIEPSEYYKDATFSRAQFKAALKALDGEDKNTFAAMFPDTILAEAGLSKQEIKGIRDTTSAKYDQMLAQAIMGLNEKSDDVLKTDGMAHAEIEQIRNAAQSIQEQGEAAVHELKASAINEHGIEHLLANVTVHQPKYLGKVQDEGRSVLAANDESNATAGENRQQVANDDDYHASREFKRRSHPEANRGSRLN